MAITTTPPPPDSVILDKVSVIASTPWQKRRSLLMILVFTLLSSAAQVLLKFVVSHPAITCAIPATSNVEHLKDNMNACFGRLPDEKLRTRIATELNAA